MDFFEMAKMGFAAWVGFTFGPFLLTIAALLVIFLMCVGYSWVKYQYNIRVRKWKLQWNGRGHEWRDKDGKWRGSWK